MGSPSRVGGSARRLLRQGRPCQTSASDDRPTTATASVRTLVGGPTSTGAGPGAQKGPRHREFAVPGPLVALLVESSDPAAAAKATEDEQHEGDDDQDDENGPQHGVTPSGWWCGAVGARAAT